MKSFAVLSAYDISEYSFKNLESGIIPFEASFRAAAALPDCKKILVLTSCSCEEPINSILKNIKSEELKIDWKVSVLEKISPQAVFEEAAKEAESSGFENVFFLHGDEPFIDLNAAEKLFKQHMEYRAEYSFADGYPEGLLPEILTSGLCPILAKLSENETSFERSFIFDTIKKEINSYDIETMIAPFDLRHLRLRFAADSKRNALLCSRFEGINAENYAELINKKQEELFTLPAYYSLEINSSYPLKSIYKPNEILLSEEKNEMDKTALFSLIEKIAEYSDDAVISLSVFGEPSLYSDTLSVIEKILSFPKLSVLIETCGLYWPSSFIENVEKIIASAPKRKNKMLPVYWIVCIDAVSSGMYAKVHCLCEDEANIKLKQALTFTDSLKKVFPDAVWAQIMRMKENEVEVEPFYRFWKNLGVNVIIQKYDTFCKLLEDKRVADLSPFNRHPCWHLKRDLYVLTDGSVPLCKEDVKRKNILGNAFSDSLDSIRKKASEVYRQHLECKYGDLCGYCDEYYTYNF
ncbi:spiro-SPASM protein [Treponema sp. OMZ 788]|uniref:spiro-SPASM protein n=1 Tax=Treponema sp. OMZ 788 TaxID=2563664 RepID=UPI0020A41ADF|nr:spiro-SPASM protein [Treponema sp. OMZ 788]UTC63678.1 spiro-SPASM protein [Treponema sp. OMZ 788]